MFLTLFVEFVELLTWYACRSLFWFAQKTRRQLFKLFLSQQYEAKKYEEEKTHSHVNETVNYLFIFTNDP